MESRVVIVWLALAAAAAGAESGGSFAWSREEGSFGLMKDGKPVWRFRYGADVPKPMFHPLALVDGTVLTWEAPPDHAWHHAFWFAWKYLNGVNYWEENPKGEPKGVTEWKGVRVKTLPGYSARIGMDLAYRPEGGKPVLSERREIAVSAPAADGSYCLDWTATFRAEAEEVAIDRTPILGEKDGKAWGGYAGLSVRFAKELADWQAVSTEGPVSWNKGQTSQAIRGFEGVESNGIVAGRGAGIALLDHPGNLHAPSPWYLVLNPANSFAFSEAAVIYYQPHRLRRGERFTLRYRAVVHEGRWDAARLRAACQDYRREAGKKR